MLLKLLLRTLLIDLSIDTFFKALPDPHQFPNGQIPSGTFYERIIRWNIHGDWIITYHNCRIIFSNEEVTQFQYDWDSSQLFDFDEGLIQTTIALTPCLRFDVCY